MDPIKHNTRSYALLLAFLVVPRFALIFSSVMVSNEKGWLWTYDPVIVAGYLCMIALFFVFWRNEQKAPNITREIPHQLILIILVFLVLIPLLAYVGFDSLQVRPLYSLLSLVVSWGVLILVAIIVPYFIFTGGFTTRQRTFTVMAALTFLFAPSQGPLFHYFGWVQGIIENGGVQLYQVLSVVLLAAYFLFVGLLFATQADARGVTGFATFAIALALMTYGLGNPVNFGSKASAYVVTTYVNGVPVGSSIMQALRVNVAVIAAILLLVAYLFGAKRAFDTPTGDVSG